MQGGLSGRKGIDDEADAPGRLIGLYERQGWCARVRGCAVNETRRSPDSSRKITEVIAERGQRRMYTRRGATVACTRCSIVGVRKNKVYAKVMSKVGSVQLAASLNYWMQPQRAQ